MEIEVDIRLTLCQPFLQTVKTMDKSVRGVLLSSERADHFFYIIYFLSFNILRCSIS